MSDKDKDSSSNLNSNSEEVENRENFSESPIKDQKIEDEVKTFKEEKGVTPPVIDEGIEVIRALSGFAAEQSHLAMQGIINWSGLNEEVGTEFARDVLASYSKVIQQARSNPMKAQGIAKMLLNLPEKRGELVAAFLFSMKPCYRNAWMQLLLQTIGCYEIASKTPKIQRAYLNARPTLAEELSEVLIKSAKPELREEIKSLIEGLKFFLK